MGADRQYCSSMVHLLRGREFGFRNILNHNIVQTRCKRNRHILHKREIGKFRSMYGYDYICTTLVTCGDWISGMNDDIYTDVITWKYRKFPIPPYYYQSDEDPSVYIPFFGENDEYKWDCMVEFFETEGYMPPWAENYMIELYENEKYMPSDFSFQY